MVGMKPDDGLYYFAHKYTAKTPDGISSPAGEEANFRLCCIRSARLIEAGWKIYSPICHTHPMHVAHAPFIARGEYKRWIDLDDSIIKHANFAGVILAPGWRKSNGCWHERDLFKLKGGSILYYAEPCQVLTEDPVEIDDAPQN